MIGLIGSEKLAGREERHLEMLQRLEVASADEAIQLLHKCSKRRRECSATVLAECWLSDSAG